MYSYSCRPTPQQYCIRTRVASAEASFQGVRARYGGVHLHDMCSMWFENARARTHTHTLTLLLTRTHAHTQIYQGELETNGELQENMVVRLKDLSADGALGKYNDALATVVEVNER